MYLSNSMYLKVFEMLILHLIIEFIFSEELEELMLFAILKFLLGSIKLVSVSLPSFLLLNCHATRKQQEMTFETR